MSIPPESVEPIARALIHAKQVVTELERALASALTHDGSARDRTARPASLDDDPPSRPAL